MHRETLDTPYGRCVLLALDDGELSDALSALPIEERDHAATLSPIRRREWISGRTALHAALGDPGVPLLSSARGAPMLPSGHVGSVSHKGTAAAAIVATVDATTGWIGIDIERAAPSKLDIASRILTDREQAALPDRGRAVTLRFALKEAIYKAVDPIVNRYVGFQEVELELLATTPMAEVAHWGCRVTSELPADIEAVWREHEISGTSFWLACARARRGSAHNSR